MSKGAVEEKPLAAFHRWRYPLAHRRRSSSMIRLHCGQDRTRHTPCSGRPPHVPGTFGHLRHASENPEARCRVGCDRMSLGNGPREYGQPHASRRNPEVIFRSPLSPIRLQDQCTFGHLRHASENPAATAAPSIRAHGDPQETRKDPQTTIGRLGIGRRMGEVRNPVPSAVIRHSNLVLSLIHI